MEAVFAEREHRLSAIIWKLSKIWERVLVAGVGRAGRIAGG